MAATDNGRQEVPYAYDAFTGKTGKGKARETHFLWWCAGAHAPLLKNCPTEHTKYAGLGGVLLATFVLAALSAGYALYSVFANPFWAAGFALVWGAVLFNFDRFLVTTMRKYGVSPGKQLLVAAPRLLLAVLIGITIARPLELKLFAKEIEVQIAENRHRKLLLNDSLLQAESRSVLEVALQERLRLNNRRSVLEDTLHRLQQAYVQEADGTGGSLHRGISQLTLLKQQAYQAALQAAMPELQQLEGQRRYQDSLVTAARAHQEQQRQLYETVLHTRAGFLEKNQALSDLSQQENSVYWANLLLSLLILLIEAGPVLSKLLMGTGPYDVALAATELQQMAASEAQLRRQQEGALYKQTALAARKKAATDLLMEKLSSLQQRYIQAELDQWEKGVDTLPDRLSLEALTRRIRQRYDYREEDVL